MLACAMAQHALPNLAWGQLLACLSGGGDGALGRQMFRSCLACGNAPLNMPAVEPAFGIAQAPLPYIAWVPEEQLDRAWVGRRRHRLAALQALMRSVEMQIVEIRVREGTLLPQWVPPLPNAFDARVSKRAWERSVMEWRN